MSVPHPDGPRPAGRRPTGKRAAERPPSRFAALGRRYRSGRRRLVAYGWSLWTLFVLVALGCAACAVLGVGPGWLDQVAAVVISTAYAVALPARTGGRPLVFGGLALAVGLLTVVLDVEMLRTGAAILTAVATSVLAVMATVPAPRFRNAVREVGVAAVVAGVGAVGVVGYRPVAALDRFDYVSLALAFGLVVVLVYNLGAGLHGLGKRGALVVLVGTISVALILAYAELLRRYGAEAMINEIYAGVAWMREHLGAAPRPLIMMIGVPALLWGCHVRARRRQGWWVCAFGVAMTSQVAGLLMNPVTGWLESVLIVVYSAVPGIAFGYALIRVDLALTGQRGARARRQEEELALRPEPRRFQPLM